jgi:uncharacterized membrane protein YqiK
MVLLSLALGVFAVLGFACQAIARAVLIPMPALAASVLAAAAEAEAATIKASGVLEMGKAEAENERLLNEARNMLSAAIIEFKRTRERIRIIPQALAEAVKAIEKISDIKIFDAGGMLGRGAWGDGHGGGAFFGEACPRT